MTEKSYIWDAAGGGDASLMPYDEDLVADWFRWLFMHDATYQGIIPGIGEELEVTNPSGTDIRIGTGAAFVYGTFYWSDEAVIDESLYWTPVLDIRYRAFLWKRWGSKAIRLNIREGTAMAYPTPIQTVGSEWEINLCDILIDTSGVVSLNDQRHFLRTSDLQVLKSPLRVGDTTDKNWNVPTDEYYGDEIWVHHTARVQVGTIRWTGDAAPSGNVAVTFPVPFAYDPTCVVEYLGTTGKIMTSVQTSITGVTIYWEDEAGDNQTSLDFQWMAAGPIMGGA